MTSILSYPERGNYGKSNWRGNTSGYVIRDIMDHFKPTLFVDACEGSGTSGDVAREMGVEYVGLDLYKGQDFTRDSILAELPREADVVFSHPPYGGLIVYSGEVWGDKAHPGDTSRCDTPEEFLAKSQVMLLNQREATRPGGYYMSLIGDQRGGDLGRGNFRSYQADFISMMDKKELLSVVIKEQHNARSSHKQYNGSFVPIMHEYLLIWKKSRNSLFQVAFNIASEHQAMVATTWRSVIRVVMMNLKEAPLNVIYDEVEKVASALVRNNKNYKAKIRQQLQRHHVNVERGVWAVAA